MLHCQKCFHELPDGTLFCDVCGTSLLAEPTLPPPSTPGIKYATPSHVPHIQVTPATPIASYPSSDHVPHYPSAPNAPVFKRVRLRLSTGRTFELTGKTEYLIGRNDPRIAQQPDVDLTNFKGADSGVSRQHAKIYITEEGVFIEDLESLNETIRNGYRLMARQWYPLADGDELRLGSITLVVALV